MNHEIEVKIRVEDPWELVKTLQTLGAEQRRPRQLEDNRLYDLDGAMASRGRLLRVRERGGQCILTAKGPPERAVEGYKVRSEEQMEVGDAAACRRVLEAAGLEVAWRYQKYRSSWELRGCDLTVDEIPHGCFLEIEGAPDQIDAVARLLGHDKSAYVIETYREIHERWCVENGVPVGGMLFEREGAEG